jgi:hypothetical protein
MHRFQMGALSALTLATLTLFGCQSTSQSQAQQPDGQNAQGQHLSYLCASDIPGTTISVQRTPTGGTVAFEAQGPKSSDSLRRAMLGQTWTTRNGAAERHLVPTRDLPNGVGFRVEETPLGAAISYDGNSEGDGDLIHVLVDADVLRLQSGGCASLQAMESASLPARVTPKPKATPHPEEDSGGSDHEPRGR